MDLLKERKEESRRDRESKTLRFQDPLPPQVDKRGGSSGRGRGAGRDCLRVSGLGEGGDSGARPPTLCPLTLSQEKERGSGCGADSRAPGGRHGTHSAALVNRAPPSTERGAAETLRLVELRCARSGWLSAASRLSPAPG